MASEGVCRPLLMASVIVLRPFFNRSLTVRWPFVGEAFRCSTPALVRGPMDDVEMRRRFANNLEYFEMWSRKIPDLKAPNQKSEDSWRKCIYFNDSKLLESLIKEKRTRYIIRYENEYEMNKKWMRNEQITVSLTPICLLLGPAFADECRVSADKANVEIINWKCKKKV